MALFRFSKAKKNEPVMTGGVFNTDVNIYKFSGKPDAYFAQILERNLPPLLYEIRRDVCLEELSKDLPSDSGSWKCACGKMNQYNFCTDCGAKRPASNTWDCPVCHRKNDTKFCPICGQISPAHAPAQGPDELGPAITLAALAWKTVNNGISKSRYPKLNFVICRDGKPKVAIYLCQKFDYDNYWERVKMDEMDMACRMKGISFQRYFVEFRNDEAYIRQRVQEALSQPEN